MDPAPVPAIEDPVLLKGRVLNNPLESENLLNVVTTSKTSNINERIKTYFSSMDEGGA